MRGLIAGLLLLWATTPALAAERSGVFFGLEARSRSATWANDRGEVRIDRSGMGFALVSEGVFSLSFALGLASGDAGVERRIFNVANTPQFLPSEAAEASVDTTAAAYAEVRGGLTVPLGTGGFALFPSLDAAASLSLGSSDTAFSATTVDAGAGLALAFQSEDVVTVRLGPRVGYRLAFFGTSSSESITLRPASFPIGARGEIEIGARGGLHVLVSGALLDETSVRAAVGWRF